MDGARLLSKAFALTSLAVIIASFAWAYSTQDFWSDGRPVTPFAATAGALAASALYARRRQVIGAMGLGFAITLLTLFGVLIITIGRWEA